MKYKNPQELPFNISDTTNDYWTIFAECPIERGSIEIYNKFAFEREMAYNKIIQRNYSHLQDASMDL